MTLRICCSMLALVAFSELTWAQRHIVPMSSNPQETVPLVPSAADPSASAAPGVACGFEETTSDGPWIFATSTGLIEVQCGTLRRYMGEGSHGQCQPLPAIPGYSEYVSTSSVANNCNGQIRFWKLAENAHRAFVAPISALDNRHVLSLFLRRSNVDFYVKGGGWPIPGWMWFTFEETDPGTEGYELIDSLTTCIHAYGGSLYSDVSHRPFYLHYVFGVPPDNAVKDFALSVGPQLAFDTTNAVDLREKENSLAHHTDRFRLVENPDRMIVRRAASFQVEVAGENELSEDCSLLHFTATHTFDGDPVEIDIPLFEGSVVPPDAWGCKVVHVEGRDPKKLLAEIHIPKDAPIGEYTFKAQFRPNGRPEILDEIEFPKKVVVLFNPWGEEDDVHYDYADHLASYVLTEAIPLLFDTDQPPRCWNLDQFSEPVLDVALKFLENLVSEERKSAIIVSRELSKQLNSDEDNGLLVGRWEPPYSGGTHPRRWTGSGQIFEQYRISNGPVSFGQCWVFGGTFVSSLRCLGIPARAVTNVMSGWDSAPPYDGQLVAIRRIDERGKSIPDKLASDKVWSFHVWAEAWMRRDDLDGRRGWQALDSGPHARPGPVQQLGPASVVEVRQKIPSLFDAMYFATAVEAPVYFKYYKGTQLLRTTLASSIVLGSTIVTQGVAAGDSSWDVRPFYKQGTPFPFPPPAQADIASFSMPSSLKPGDALKFTSRLVNQAAEPKTILLGFTLEATTALGQERGFVVDPDVMPILLAPGEVREVVTEIPWALLEPVIDDDTAFRIHPSAFCEATAEVAGGMGITRIQVPELQLTLTPSGFIRFNDVVKYKVELKNTSLLATPQAVLAFRSAGNLRFANNDRTIYVEIAPVAAGSGVVQEMTARATRRGADLVSAELHSARSEAFSFPLSVHVVGCLGDLDGGDSVDDADFSLFAQSYNAFLVPPGDPAADLNQDGIIDDADFTLFIQAYDQLACN